MVQPIPSTLVHKIGRNHFLHGGHHCLHMTHPVHINWKEFLYYMQTHVNPPFHCNGTAQSQDTRVQSWKKPFLTWRSSWCLPCGPLTCWWCRCRYCWCAQSLYWGWNLNEREKITKQDKHSFCFNKQVQSKKTLSYFCIGFADTISSFRITHSYCDIESKRHVRINLRINPRKNEFLVGIIS